MSPNGVDLPATGATVPAVAANLTVKVTGEMKTSDGVAFTATVHEGKMLLGTIENEGRGGGTWLRPASASARGRWDDIVAEHALLNPEDELVAHENLANDLYEEVATIRDMNRKRNLTVRVDKDPAHILRYNCPTTDQGGRDHVRKEFGDRAEVWVKGTGWTAL